MKFHTTNHASIAYISITVFSYTTYHQRTPIMRIKIIARATAPATAMPTIAPVDKSGPEVPPPPLPEPLLPLPDSPLPELALTANTKHKACSIIHPSYSYSTDREIITSNVPHSDNAAYRHTATQTPMVNGWLQLYGYKALCAADDHVEFARLLPLHYLVWRVHASCDSFATLKTTFIETASCMVLRARVREKSWSDDNLQEDELNQLFGWAIWIVKGGGD